MPRYAELHYTIAKSAQPAQDFSTNFSILTVLYHVSYRAFLSSPAATRGVIHLLCESSEKASCRGFATKAHEGFLRFQVIALCSSLVFVRLRPQPRGRQHYTCLQSLSVKRLHGLRAQGVAQYLL